VHGNLARCCAVLALCLAACGDSSGSKAGDGGTDASTNPNGPRPNVRDRDAATGSDVLRTCSRFEPNSCGAGERCAVALRALPDQAVFEILEICVEDGGRGLGDPCDQFDGFGVAYETPGLTDEVYVDPCGEGLYCAADLDARGGLFTCQRACESGLYAPEPAGACDDLQFCSGPGAREEVCTDSDQCDPSDPDSCGEGQGCFLWRDGEQLFTICVMAPDPETMPAEGEPCLDTDGVRYINACGPGLQCWGPAHLSPAEWSERDLVCRRSCNVDLAGDGDNDAGADTSDDDAGTDTAMDGGVDAGGGAKIRPGTCAPGQRCAPLSESSLAVGPLPDGSGLCE
jgi:hypothetical protein